MFAAAPYVFNQAALSQLYVPQQQFGMLQQPQNSLGLTNLNLESDIEAMANAQITFSDHADKHVTDHNTAVAFMRYVL